jgi:hypothetical protein
MEGTFYREQMGKVIQQMLETAKTRDLDDEGQLILERIEWLARFINDANGDIKFTMTFEEYTELNVIDDAIRKYPKKEESCNVS